MDAIDASVGRLIVSGQMLHFKNSEKGFQSCHGFDFPSHGSCDQSIPSTIVTCSLSNLVSFDSSLISVRSLVMNFCLHQLL